MRKELRTISRLSRMKMRRGKCGISFGNPSRRHRTFVFQVIKQIYNPKIGDIYNIYCVSRFNSKTLDYFIEVKPKEGCDYVITAQRWGLKNLSLRDCQNIIKSIIDDKTLGF